MKLKVRDREGITIVDLSGEVTIGEGDVALRKEINDLVGQDRLNIILNLTKVSFIDSSGIGEIVRSYTTVSKHNGRLVLLGLQSKIRDLFAITRLITIFDSYENEKEAVDSFKKTD